MLFGGLYNGNRIIIVGLKSGPVYTARKTSTPGTVTTCSDTGTPAHFGRGAAGAGTVSGAAAARSIIREQSLTACGRSRIMVNVVTSCRFSFPWSSDGFPRTSSTRGYGGRRKGNLVLVVSGSLCRIPTGAYARRGPGHGLISARRVWRRSAACHGGNKKNSPINHS